MTDCELWKGASFSTHGIRYGLVGRHGLAHRVAYEQAKGPIPAGYVIDHLCKNGLCVNPDHLEAVSNRENILRGNGAPAINARKTYCIRNHELTPANIWNRSNGRRDCKLCDVIRRSGSER